MSQHAAPTTEPVLPSDREYLIERRRAILVELAAIEKRLDLPRTVPSRAERRAAEMWGRNGRVAEE